MFCLDRKAKNGDGGCDVCHNCACSESSTSTTPEITYNDELDDVVDDNLSLDQLEHHIRSSTHIGVGVNNKSLRVGREDVSDEKSLHFFFESNIAPTAVSFHTHTQAHTYR